MFEHLAVDGVAVRWIEQKISAKTAKIIPFFVLNSFGGTGRGIILKRQFTINVKQQKARSAHARVKKLLVLKVN